MVLFPAYPAEPGTIESAGADARARATTLAGLKGDLQSASTYAASTVSDSLRHDVLGSVAHAKSVAGDLDRASWLVTGVCSYFASAVTTYNTGVTALNKTWEAAAGNDFGVSATTGTSACYASPDDVPPGEHEAAVSAARSALRAQLVKAEQALLKDLDQAGREAARMLDKGPDDTDTILTLGAVGALPPAAFDQWPKVVFDELRSLRAFYKGVKNLKEAPAAIAKLREIFRLSKDTQALVDKLLGAEKNWNAVWDAIANSSHIDPKSMAALDSWLRGNSEIADLRHANELSEARLAAAGDGLIDELKITSKVGKGLGLLDLGLSSYDAFTLVRDWDDQTTGEKVGRSIEDGAGIAGGIATIAVIAGASGPAAPVVIVVAGVIGGAAAIYNNWDTISDAAGKAWDWTEDRADDVKEWAGDQVDDAKEDLKSIGDGISGAADWAADKLPW